MQNLKKMVLKIMVDKSLKGVQHPITQYIRFVWGLTPLPFGSNVVYAGNVSGKIYEEGVRSPVDF